jgi:Spy/CpxP family protein refolding chaperone
MRSLFHTVVVVALAAVLAAPALAQRPGGGRGGMMGGPALLANKSVQDELKLTDDQKATIKKIVEERTAAAKKARDDMDRDAARAAREKATKALAKVESSLKPAQAKRFKQIQYQVGGAHALASEKVQKELGLKDKQVDEIKDALKTQQTEMQELFRGARGDREKAAEARKKMQELRKKTEAKITKVLTDEQKKKWEEMKGPKFEFKPDRPSR